MKINITASLTKMITRAKSTDLNVILKSIGNELYIICFSAPNFMCYTTKVDNPLSKAITINPNLLFYCAKGCKTLEIDLIDGVEAIVKSYKDGQDKPYRYAQFALNTTSSLIAMDYISIVDRVRMKQPTLIVDDFPIKKFVDVMSCADLGINIINNYGYCRTKKSVIQIFLGNYAPELEVLKTNIKPFLEFFKNRKNGFFEEIEFVICKTNNNLYEGLRKNRITKKLIPDEVFKQPYDLSFDINGLEFLDVMVADVLDKDVKVLIDFNKQAIILTSVALGILYQPITISNIEGRVENIALNYDAISTIYKLLKYPVLTFKVSSRDIVIDNNEGMQMLIKRASVIEVM